MFCRDGRTLTNSLTISIEEIVSRTALFSFINVKALNLFWLMVERSQVFKRLIVENDLSGVADVAPIVKTNLIMMTTFLINLCFSFDNDCISSTTSLKLTEIHERWLATILIHTAKINHQSHHKNLL